MYAPIVLFVYARLEHLKKTIESLIKNPESSSSDLIIFSDAAKNSDYEFSVIEVRKYLELIKGFRSVKIIKRPHNYGLSASIIDGITQVLKDYESVIVLEDDICTSSSFLNYMNSALKLYAYDERVISIHGYVYPVKNILPSAFFLRGADCWGWATWRRGWEIFNGDGNFLLNELKRTNLVNSFDLDGAHPFSKMLEHQTKGLNDSWAIRWHASAFLANKLTLYPGKSLVQNIGNDNSGTHCGISHIWDTTLSHDVIDLSTIKVKEHYGAKKIIKNFFLEKKPLIDRFIFRIKNYCFLDHIKFVLKSRIPPEVISQVRNIRWKINKTRTKFTGPYGSWGQALSESDSYENQDILKKVFESSLKVKEGKAAFERDSILFEEINYSWPVIAGLCWGAARKNGDLSVLDFGGSLGSSYYQLRSLLASLNSIRWSIVEQKHFVEIGRNNFESHQLIFYESIKECVKNEQPNVVLLSSVLQYLEKPFDILEELASLDAAVIIIDMLIIHKLDRQLIYLQKVPENIYSASYPVWTFPLQEVINIVQAKGYALVSEFDSLEFPELNSINSVFKGLIFSKGV